MTQINVDYSRYLSTARHQDNAMRDASFSQPHPIAMQLRVENLRENWKCALVRESSEPLPVEWIYKMMSFNIDLSRLKKKKWSIKEENGMKSVHVTFATHKETCLPNSERSENFSNQRCQTFRTTSQSYIIWKKMYLSSGNNLDFNWEKCISYLTTSHNCRLYKSCNYKTLEPIFFLFSVWTYSAANRNNRSKINCCWQGNP